MILMSKRITIMLDDEIAAKLRGIQAQQLKKSEGSVSFSNVINQVLSEGLKKFK